MLKLTQILFLAGSLVFFSCANRKKIAYFQGDKDISTDTLHTFSPVLKNDDLLSITIMGIDAEAVKPFNLSTYGQYSGQSQQANASVAGAGYLVDKNGEIEFPVVGKIKVAGLSRPQAADLIKARLKDYLKEPIVNIQVLNYKITILGDVNRPGIYTIPNERITIVEAIGLAGDLNMTGMRKNILVIRDENGKRTETRVDITNKSIFNSSVYYLQQNDVVYVEPNRPKKNSSVINTTSITLFISTTTLLITFITLLTR